MFKQLITKFKSLIENTGNNHSTLTLIGKQGEQLAVNFLKKEKKYKILDTNWKHKNDEIDIVAQDGEIIVFIEVKTRLSESTPLSMQYRSVTKKKKKSLARVCKYYLKYNKTTSRHFRFDIVLVKLCKNKENIIQHYSNIKLFSKYFHTLSYD